jgi:penicillin-binding protein 1A
LVTGVWVGGEDRAVHFASVKYGQGAAMALPIWGIYMKSCYADKTLNISKEAFDKPSSLSISVDCSDADGKTVTEDADAIENDMPDELAF